MYKHLSNLFIQKNFHYAVEVSDEKMNISYTEKTSTKSGLLLLVLSLQRGFIVLV